MEEEGANPTDAIHEICKKVADSKLDVKFTQGTLEIDKIFYSIIINFCCFPGQKEFHAAINKVGKAIDKVIIKYLFYNKSKLIFIVGSNPTKSAFLFVF